LDRPFRILAFDWDGTAVANRQEDASPVRGVLEDLLRLGTVVAVITGTNFPNVDRQLTAAIQGAHKRLLYVLTNRGSEVYGFDAQSRPALLWARVAMAAEDSLLDRIAETVRADLVARTGLDIRVISDRMNRRKIDLIPLPEWSDPPKSALGELARAVESRLRGAGLPGGLRQAIELVEQTARAKGLTGARVTSDFKHVEVGLTDKSDAMNWVMENLARERGVPAEEVLIGGDEFGAPAGIEGSDHKMMTPRARGAVVVSVGPEPEGVPPGVIHLGGGPARFRTLLAAQAALLERGDWRPAAGKRAESDCGELPAAPTGDPGWLVVKEGYSPAREPEIESLLTAANGYAGTRGSLAEGSPASAPATFVGGLYRTAPAPGTVPELMTLPDWTHLRVLIQGQPLHLGDQGTLAHRRLLDLRQGMLWREWRHRDAAGRVTRLRFLRLLSLAERHAFLQSLALTPENYSGPVVVESRLPAPSHQTGAPSSSQDGILALPVEGSGLTVALAWSDLCSEAESRSVEPGPEGAGRPALARWAFQAEAGRTYRLDRLVSVCTPREAARPAGTAGARLRRLRAAGVRDLAEAHARAWAERWRTADVQVDGDEEAQRALRLAAYHLIGAADPGDERASAGARGLTGEAYKGHVFWDTEIFAFPFYLFTHPPTARALLMYRYHTLPAARDKARARGYRGALYSWESAGDGREATPDFVVGPDGVAIPIRCGQQEHHISADVAYAVWNYWRVSGDDDFFLRAGAEILLETARFWASRGRFAADGRYHILGVIGPDEYHEGVDDNAYTNVLAQWNLGRALRAARALEERWPRRRRELFERLGIAPEEPAQWRRAAERMYTGFDPRTGLFEQFRGYFGLEEIDLAAYEPRTVPMDVVLGRERTARAKVVKQADVVMLLALLWGRFAPAVRRANFRYYEPRTGHGSSLSPATHAVVAARLGDGARAERYFRQAAAIDLANGMGNSAGGVHLAALGGLWQAAVLGFAGLVPTPGGLLLAPRLPRPWRRLSFHACWRGRDVLIVLAEGPRIVEVRMEGPGPMELKLRHGPSTTLTPGRRYLCRGGPAGWGPWQAKDRTASCSSPPKGANVVSEALSKL
jgi:kojibiose phosphorylase